MTIRKPWYMSLSLAHRQLSKAARVAPILGILGAGCTGSVDHGVTQSLGQIPVADTSDSALADSPKVLAEQTFTIEPGHTLQVTRFEDDGILFAESGALDVHIQALGELAAGRTITETVRLLVPDAMVSPALAAELQPFAPRVREDSKPPLIDGSSLGVDSLSPQASRAITKAAPRSDDVPTSGAVTTSDYTVLKCDDRALTQCLTNRSVNASATWDWGGYYRTRAVNRDRVNATHVISVWSYIQGRAVPIQSVTMASMTWSQIQYLPPSQNWATASVTTSGSGKVGLSVLVTSLGPRAQERPLWCWATSAQMVTSVFGSPPEQCEIAMEQWPTLTDCCTTAGACNGGGEVYQPLTRWGYSFSNQAIPSGGTELKRLLHHGPVAVYQSDPSKHYTVLTDYKEFYEGGAWVPYALKLDPGPQQVYSQERHLSWVKLSEVSTADGGYGKNAYGDIHPASTGLNTDISEVWWKSTGAGKGKVFARVSAPDSVTYELRLYDSGGPSGVGSLWSSGSIAAVHSGKQKTTDYEFNFNVGPWLWYDVWARACANGTCGVWMSKRSVSKSPVQYIDSLTWSGGTLTAAFRAEAAPTETTFHYRILDMTSSPNVVLRAMETAHDRQASVTYGRFNAKATVTMPVPAGITAKVQMQACSATGCSPWAAKQIVTGN